MDFVEPQKQIDREIHEHEIFLSFNSDDEAQHFHEWWNMEGFDSFERSFNA